VVGEDYSRNYLDEGLLALVIRLKEAGKTVHIVEGVPEQSFDVSYTVGRHLGFGADLPPAIDAVHAQNRARIFDRIGKLLDDAGAHSKFTVSKAHGFHAIIRALRCERGCGTRRL